MKDGKFLASDSTVPSGQELVAGLLERCLKWCDIVQDKYADQFHYKFTLTSIAGKATSMKGFKKHMTSSSQFETT